MIGPSLGHIAISAALFGASAGLWMLGLRGPHWAGFMVAVAWSVSRELAQKWRSPTNAGPPLTMDNVRQAGWPSLAALVAAVAIEVAL